MPDDDSQSDLAKKRTARVQLTNGALEARAYVGPTEVPVEAAHKTIEMRTVAVDESLDPRRRATVARGMGEALASIEGEIVDPVTGQVIPAVDPHAVPNTPWAHGKRPTHWKGAAPPVIGKPNVGVAAAPASKPGYGAYAVAAAIVVAALIGATVMLTSHREDRPSAAPSGAPAPLVAPLPTLTPTASASVPPVVVSAPQTAPTPAPPADSGPLRVGPRPVNPPPSKPSGATPPASAPSKPGDRIF